MADEKVTTTETVVDDAERARAAADAASEAAASAAALAAVEAANVKQQASEKIAEVEGGLAEWQSSHQRRAELLEQRAQELESKHEQTMEALRSIQSRLDKPPEPPPSPPPDLKNPAESKTPPPPEPESPPAKRRAHRWI
jgi:hypothetical protein